MLLWMLVIMEEGWKPILDWSLHLIFISIIAGFHRAFLQVQPFYRQRKTSRAPSFERSYRQHWTCRDVSQQAIGRTQCTGRTQGGRKVSRRLFTTKKFDGKNKSELVTSTYYWRTFLQTNSFYQRVIYFLLRQ